MTRNEKKFSKGFGLLEVMISATIIIIILGSLVLVARASMNNNQYIQMRAEATYLAQEGIERVRSTRDSNWIDQDTNTTWNNLELSANADVIRDGIASGCYEVGKTSDSFGQVRFNLVSASVPSAADCEGYALNNNTTYTESIVNYPAIVIIGKPPSAMDLSAPANKYYRNVYIDKLINENDVNFMNGLSPNSNAIKVTANVGFKFNGKQKVISVSEIMTNWRPSF